MDINLGIISRRMEIDFRGRKYISVRLGVGGYFLRWFDFFRYFNFFDFMRLKRRCKVLYEIKGRLINFGYFYVY